MSNFIRNDKLMNGFAASSSTSTAKTGATVVTITSSTVTGFAEEFDTHGTFDPATGRFTPTVAGYYSFQSSITGSALATAAIAYFRKNGTVIDTDRSAQISGAATVSPHGTVYMNGSTDYVDFAFDPAGDTAYNIFSVRIEGVLEGI